MLLDSLQPGEVVGVDTETNGFSPRLGARVTVVSMAWRSPDGVGHSLALPFGQGEGREQVWAPEGAWEMVLEKLAMSRLAMFHAYFDHGMLRAGTNRSEGADLGAQVEWCGMVAEKAIVGGASGGLKTTGERYDLIGGREREGESKILAWLEEHHMDRGDIHRIPWPIISPYARFDAILAFRLYEAQQSRLLLSPPALQAQVAAKMAALKEKLASGVRVEIDMAVA